MEEARELLASTRGPHAAARPSAWRRSPCGSTPGRPSPTRRRRYASLLLHPLPSPSFPLPRPRGSRSPSPWRPTSPASTSWETRPAASRTPRSPHGHRPRRRRVLRPPPRPRAGRGSPPPLAPGGDGAQGAHPLPRLRAPRRRGGARDLPGPARRPGGLRLRPHALDVPL